MRLEFFESNTFLLENPCPLMGQTAFSVGPVCLTVSIGVARIEPVNQPIGKSDLERAATGHILIAHISEIQPFSSQIHNPSNRMKFSSKAILEQRF